MSFATTSCHRAFSVSERFWRAGGRVETVKKWRWWRVSLLSPFVNTPGWVWEWLGAQVFQITAGVQQHEAFVIRQRQVYRLGKSFGGKGVRSPVVADPGDDGRDMSTTSPRWRLGVRRN
jgi:hypothetical protein